MAVGAAWVLPQNMCIVTNLPGYQPVPVGWCSFNPDIEEVPQTGHDANNNGVDDGYDIDLGTSQDTNGNLIPDEAETCFEPETTAEPSSQIVVLGAPLNLGVSGSGSAPFTYQWYLGASALTDGPNISGATTASLSIGAVGMGDLGDYTVVV